jgi:hypothetical protein
MENITRLAHSSIKKRQWGVIRNAFAISISLTYNFFG